MIFGPEKSFGSRRSQSTLLGGTRLEHALAEATGSGEREGALDFLTNFVAEGGKLLLESVGLVSG